MNITNTFWSMIEAIILLPYDDFTATKYYNVMKVTMDNDESYVIEIYGETLYFNDVSSLFYGVRDHLLEKGYREESQIVHHAITKMLQTIDTMEMCDDIETFSITTDTMSSLTKFIDKMRI
jgi:hypothetical protein